MSSERSLAIEVGVPGTPSAAYDVLLERGGLSDLGRRVAERMPAHRHVLIADSRVAKLHAGTAMESLESAGCDAELLVFPAGEWNKSRAAWGRLTDEMMDLGMGRDTAIVALGGGVAGDLAGFVAATYMRGIPFAIVPTSLLAMVDSGLGGKTGLDTDRAKNAVGAFHHPSFVLVDPDLLGTLPRPHLRAGIAEAIKTAAIRDADRFEWLEAHAAEVAAADPEALTELIVACVRIKAAVVSVDPREAGERQVLNFGHTAAHALESIAGLALLHGEAVAAGMRLESLLGEALGITEPGTGRRIADLLAACEVPNLLDGTVRAADLIAAAAGDKKNRAGRLRWVLLERIGAVAQGESAAWSVEVDAAEAEAHLESALRAAAEASDSLP